jgi:hypothetical protein
VEKRCRAGLGHRWRMRIAFFIPKAAGTHSEYVILIAFKLQKLLHERALLIRYSYIACLINNSHPSNRDFNE